MPSPIKFINYTKSSIASLLRKHSRLSASHILQTQAAAHVYPFRANNYVIENLIDWSNVPNDPMFQLTFPQPEMLKQPDMDSMLSLMAATADQDSPRVRQALRQEASRIRQRLNPHPAKQKELNVPTLRGQRVPGVQHKYRETMLFFASEAQWCHAYCTYCFRWAQFTEVGSAQQFKSKDAAMLVDYISHHPQLSDLLFTGGDPAVMRTSTWRAYLEPLLASHDCDHLRNIRVGTKSLTYWPYRYTHNDDADDLLRLFERCAERGKHVTIQAHFTHTRELETPAVAEAVRRLRMAGCNIRSQAPMIRGINDDARVWRDMWAQQVAMGIIPYYMFVERDTGPKHHFEVPLVKAYEVFRDAVAQVSGIARTVRGPSMSCEAGKVQVVGVLGDMMILQFLQARNPEWMKTPFLAKRDDAATWIDDLKPYDGSESFFYQRELDEMIDCGVSSGQMMEHRPVAKENLHHE